MSDETEPKRRRRFYNRRRKLQRSVDRCFVGGGCDSTCIKRAAGYVGLGRYLVGGL